MPTCSTLRPMRIIRNEPRSKLCRQCSRKNPRGEMMNRLPSVTFRLAVAAIVLCSGVSVSPLRAQTSAPPPTAQAPAQGSAPEPAKKPDADDGNPFAPQPAPTLPPGMTGSDVNDPRFKLTPGLYDAGETTLGIKHLQLLKKPDAFQLGSSNADDPKVQHMLGQLGIGGGMKIPKELQLVIAELAFSNSDLAFQGNHLFLGNFYGVNIYDISNPAQTALVTSMVCPGGQGDVSVYKNLLFMSVEMPNGRLDCGTQGFPPEPPPAAGHEKERHPPAAQKDRFRGVRIFDITDIKDPKQVAAVQTCRGSHTHTLVLDPNDKDNVYIYISGTGLVRQTGELAGCSDGDDPAANPNTSRFSIDIIQVPLAHPELAKIVSSPRIFTDAQTGAINGLWKRGNHGEGTQTTSGTDKCHDITVYAAIGL